MLNLFLFLVYGEETAQPPSVVSGLRVCDRSVSVLSESHFDFFCDP